MHFKICFGTFHQRKGVGIRHNFIRILILSSICFCGEVDHYLAWGQSLGDASEILNIKINEIINATVQGLPKDCSCEDAAGKVLSGFGVSLNSKFEKWIKETEKVDKFMPNINLALRESIFSDHDSKWSQIERAYFTIQLDEIINVGGIYIGLDKLTHFTGSGYLYYKTYQFSKKAGSRNPFGMAIKIGIAGEKTVIGRMATGVFSYGDLEANYQGLKFGIDMCEGNNPYLKKSKDGWEFSRVFDINSYVNPNWDESYNPSFYYDGLNIMLSPKSTIVQKNIPDFCDAYRSSFVIDQLQYYDSIEYRSASFYHLDSLISIGDLPNPSMYNIKNICKD